jgi:hypothetical protein
LWGGIDLLADKPTGPYMSPEVASRRARNMVDGARKAVGDYLKAKSPNPNVQRSLAEYALRLAKLDAVVRALRLDPTFEEAAPEDVEDLLGMLALVPFDRLTHAQALYLNPTFGEASSCIGGADADLVAGGLLVDFKTTKEAEINASYLDQLLGYLLLARRHRQAEPNFPEIKGLGLYYCRHGYLWTADASVWTSQPAFAELEQWFFRQAQEVFGARV